MLFGDILNAFRVWRRRPLVAAAAILTFALGAGANLAVFRLMWTVMLRPLPYADAGSIMQVWQDDGKDARAVSRKELIDRWRETNRSFGSLTNFRPWQVTIGGGGGAGNPENVRVGLVSAEFFETLGVSMQAGRAFTREETRAGTDRAVILSHGYWTRRFAADHEIIGREIQADGESCRVVGILPAGFSGVILGGANELDAYLPISRAKVGAYALPTSFVAGRLKAGVTPTQAQADLAAISATMPKSGTPARVWISPVKDEIGLSLRPALITLFGATVCVLLVACLNIANLLMAHAAARQRELAIRVAVGASRAQLIRQLLIESVVLAMAGGAAAFAAASVLTRAMVALYPVGIPRAEESGGNDTASIGAAFAVALGCGLLAGLLPAWRVTGGKMEDWLRVGHGWMARARRRWADALVTAQVMLTVAVLVGAGLLLKSFILLRGTDPGFTKEHVITAAVGLPSAVYGQRPDQARFADRLAGRLQSMPGVIASGLTNSLPLRYTVLLSMTFRLAGEAEQLSMGRGVAGSYFQAMGLRMIAGRPLGPQDDGRKDVVVVNEAFVRRFLPGRVALGTQFAEDGASIVGIVKDVHHRGLRQAAEPEIYFPLSKLPSASIGIVIRSMVPPGEMTSALRRELQAIDNRLALDRVMTLDEVVDTSLARPRFQTILLALFAAVALLLAAVGGYSVVAQSLRARTQEFGVRRAVGAQTGDILLLVAREGMRAPLLGLAMGCALAWAAGRYLSSILYGVTPLDPGVWSAALGVLTLVCLAACAWAGRLAVRVQPTEALRNE